MSNEPAYTRPRKLTIRIASQKSQTDTDAWHLLLNNRILLLLNYQLDYNVARWMASHPPRYRTERLGDDGMLALPFLL